MDQLLILILLELCRHNISKATIQKKLDTFELIIPRFYAWFFNQADSKLICSMAKKCFDQCLEILELKTCFKKTKNSFIFEDLFEIRNQEQVHCTAKFLSKEICPEYFFDPEVNQCMGRMFPIEIAGFSITNRSIAADICLRNVGNLWKNDLNENEMEEAMQNINELSDKTIFDKLEYADRAHITIGLEPNLSANKSGIDLITLKLLRIKKSYTKFQTDDFNLFYFGDCLCYAELKKTVKIPSLFAAQY